MLLNQTSSRKPQNSWTILGLRLTDDSRVYESWAKSVEAHAQLLAYGVDWDPTLYLSGRARNYKQAAQTAARYRLCDRPACASLLKWLKSMGI